MKAKIFLAVLAILTSINVKAGSYVEFKLTISKETGYMKMYNQDGNSRTEMNWKSPSMPGGEMNIVNIILKSDAHKTYTLNEKEKTYSVSDWSAYESKAKEQEYEVTVIGNEKVNGYNAVHVKLKRKSSQTTQDLWMSKEVQNFEMYKSIQSKYTSSEMYNVFKDKGVDGFPVRILADEHGRSFQMDLVKAETKTIAASLFSLDGYKKSEAPAGVSNSMIQQYQNMTPEERKKMIDQMKKQYEKPQPK